MKNHKLFIRANINNRESFTLAFSERKMSQIRSNKEFLQSINRFIKLVTKEAGEKIKQNRKVDIKLFINVDTKFNQDVAVSFTLGSINKVKQTLTAYLKEHVLKPLHHEFIK